MTQLLLISALVALTMWGVAFAMVAPLAPGYGAPGLFFDRINRVDNFGLGKTALITPSLGATYDKFVLLLGGGLVAADLLEVRILANDVEVFKDTGSFLDIRQAYIGASTNAGEVVIDLTEPRARGGAAEQYLASLPANLLKKLQIEVDINAGANALSTLAAAAEFRGRTTNPYILKRRRILPPQFSIGDNDVFLPAGKSGGLIKRIWINDTAHMTAAELKVGGFRAMRFKTVAELTRMEARQVPALVPQANWRVLDFVADGNLQGMLNTASDAQQAPDAVLTITSDAAVQMPIFVDYIDPIDRLK